MNRTRDYLTTIVIAAAFCVMTAERAEGQQHRASFGQKSTQAGVYTAEQAARGEDLYAGMCRSCHTAASHTGVAFQKSWEGRALSDLFGYVSTKMPKNEPGSLAPEQYVDLLAYLLKLNQMPVGAAELPADTLALSAIRIETRAAPSHPEKR